MENCLNDAILTNNTLNCVNNDIIELESKFKKDDTQPAILCTSKKKILSENDVLDTAPEIVKNGLLKDKCYLNCWNANKTKGFFPFVCKDESEPKIMTGVYVLVKRIQNFIKNGKCYVCSVCSKLFTHLNDLRIHENTHKLAHQNHNCEHPKVQPAIVRKPRKRQHKRRKKSSSMKKASVIVEKLNDSSCFRSGSCYVCCICSKLFQRMSDLKRHEDSHLEPKESVPVTTNCDSSEMDNCENSDFRKESPKRRYLRRYLEKIDVKKQGDHLPVKRKYVRRKHKQIDPNKEEKKKRAPKLKIKTKIRVMKEENGENNGVNEQQDESKCSQNNGEATEQSEEQKLLLTEGAEVKIFQKKNGVICSKIILPCSICKRTFVHPKSLETHLKRHAEKSLFVCKVCGRTFSYHAHLLNHLKSHSTERAFPCKVCDKRFSTEMGLNEHKRRHTGIKPYTCQLCGRNFFNRNSLKYHSFSHTGKKPFVCNICGASFTASSSLKNHKRIHTGEKPYNCKLCDKAFTQLWNLKVHERKHREEKPYKCDMCDKSFVQVAHITVHKMTHLKPHECSYCGKRFARFERLTEHKLKHTSSSTTESTNEMMYVCLECGETFSDLSLFNVHTVSHYETMEEETVVDDESCGLIENPDIGTTDSDSAYYEVPFYLY